MHIQQRVKSQNIWTAQGQVEGFDAKLALVFGATATLRQSAIWDELKRFYPHARMVGCSTAGEIAGTRVFDDSLAVTAMSFEHSQFEIASVQLSEASDGVELGKLLAGRLPQQALRHVLIFSDGLKVNGSDLVAGVAATIPSHVAVTGGLAGDGARFERTAVCLDGPEPFEQIIAIGLYGSRLRVGYGSVGGWDPFGPERRITKSQGNVLHELDGEPALDLYKRYLGEHANDLPASGLLFPLTICHPKDGATAVVRTILAVDEQARTLTFAGDMPQEYRARLVRANFERLVEGASDAALVSQQPIGANNTSLAILISCVGRKLVLKQRIEEEVEAVRDVLGEQAVLAGFYSYGEISPFASLGKCELHNQTMTITTLTEM